MKSVLISIHTKWCELIASGKKTIEVRKTAPKSKTPFKVYIYCTNSKEKLWVLKETERAFTPEKIASICAAKDVGGTYKANGKVIGEFVCDSIEDFSKWQNDYPSLLRHINLYAGTNSDYKFIDGYLRGHKTGYGWHISDLKIYDKPRELNEFYKVCNFDKCEGCPHLYVENTPGSYETWCEFDEKMPIARPPQSWQYVEEI